ncbi:MAG: Minichromosome maintenance protein MCM [Methanothrix harundinacea]|uniref:DNA helicase n=1 Tax=Methanothrix harundinacea TaxID=301375 RepID=A0A101IIQ4_9EURY|nr:MAG: Minichromosome maintenance protein MCM [Methanothrix harundinacea]KUK95990.1 MAG: Minichromosome maintenance protein MCM [Methanothrix harundinacea]
MKDEEIYGFWSRYLDERLADEVAELAEKFPDRRGLLVSWRKLYYYNSDFGDAVRDKASEAIPAGERALKEALQNCPVDLIAAVDRVHLQISDLGGSVRMADLRSYDVGSLIQVDVLVRVVSSVSPKLTKAWFECKRCGHKFAIDQPVTKFREPSGCPNESCDRKGPFVELEVERELSNFQVLTVQDLHDGLKTGEQPQEMDVYMVDDLTGQVFPGARVRLTGILRANPKVTSSGRSTIMSRHIEAVHIERLDPDLDDLDLSDEDVRIIRELSSRPSILDDIRDSVAPSVSGYPHLKEAIAIQLAGSPVELRPGNHQIRGDIHLLLVGDPGIAKSQHLLAASKLSPRGRFVSGGGASGPGLTAAATRDKEEGSWRLEAGALVLASGGLASIDELDKMRDDDRGSLHEAMEQQTTTISKAGINARLPTRCSILAAANPKHGRFDKYDSIPRQINLPPALLSRFDLIFVMSDDPNEEKDRELADFILSEEEGTFKPPIDPDLLTKYFIYSKSICPKLTDTAQKILADYYVEMRKGAKPGLIPVTPRQLEALKRLAKGSARLRLSVEVGEEDAKRAVRLMDFCLRQAGMDENGFLDVDKIFGDTTSKERATMKFVMDIIQRLSKKGSSTTREIVRHATAEDIREERVLKTLKRLKKEGEVAEQNGLWRLS